MDDTTCSGGCACQEGRRDRGQGSGQGERVAASGGATGVAARIADDRGAVNRRAVLTGSVAVLATMAVGACAASEDAGAPGDPESATPAETKSAPPDPTESESGSTSASESAAESESASADGGSGEAIAGTGDFPVGGGVVVTTDSGTVVVTHPSDTEFKAFNGKCPHQGCPVSEVTENTIVCMCHGSTFDGTTGDRLEGPAPTGLQAIPITVEGDLIYVP